MTNDMFDFDEVDEEDEDEWEAERQIRGEEN